MPISKTHFEQIPLEAVKKIATEFPDSDIAGNNGAKTETPEGTTDHQEHWREVAQQVQTEQDPNKIIALAQELISTFDKERLEKRQRERGMPPGAPVS